MDYKKFLNVLGFTSKEKASADIFSKEYPQAGGYRIEVDLKKSQINYGKKIKAENKTTQNFSQPENFVVLECVNRLLEKGYKPENIILEKTWGAGHGTSGRLDICVTREDNSEFLLIECKTYGKEFDKEFNRMKKDGGQLFTYFKFSNKADVIMLYASELREKKIIYHNEIIKIKDDYRIGDVKDFHEKWDKLTNKNGVFEDEVKPYCFENKAKSISELDDIDESNSEKLFYDFLKILRANAISDKPNAFNKIFNLFICKIYDEWHNENNGIAQFVWKNDDYPEGFISRLTKLYEKAIDKFLNKRIMGLRSLGNLRSKGISESIIKELEEMLVLKNNDFAVLELIDKNDFYKNTDVVKSIVQLLENLRIRYDKKNNYLSNFFEQLLTTGLKQEAGQFFTPVPIAKFILKSIPLKEKVDESLAQGELPKIIDYAAGSGHFIHESMHEIQSLLDDFESKCLQSTSTKEKINTWKTAKYSWASESIYGIERDYRLSKVAKVGCYMHGDGVANIINSSGLDDFYKSKSYIGALKLNPDDRNDNYKKQGIDNPAFDFVVSNPPFSIDDFVWSLADSRNSFGRGQHSFDLYDAATDKSKEIECLFVERTKQLLKDGGVAGIILPSSILSNEGIYTKAREIILRNFEVVAITELGSNTFMATGTNTVVLFLRRVNNYKSTRLKESVDEFFINFQEITLNGIETPFSKYIQHVWENITLNDYVALIKNTPNTKVENHEFYKNYRKSVDEKIESEISIRKQTRKTVLPASDIEKIKERVEKECWDAFIEIEKEKLLYFILAYPQKVVIVKTGEKDAEKRFLGYKFSNRRGSEGIHPIRRGKTITKCTRLFDETKFDNPQKASTYIYKAFSGDYEYPIHESLANNISRVRLVDMLTFDRPAFAKSISAAVKKKVRYDEIWKTGKLVSLNDVSLIQKGTSITQEKTIAGNIPVVAGGKEPAYFHNVSNRNGNIITISASGAYSGFVNYFENSIFASDCNTIQSKDENNISTKLIYLFLKSIQEVIYKLQRGQAQPHVYGEDLAQIEIPLPPKEIQKKIVAEIEALEKQEATAKRKVEEGKESIEQFFTEAYNKSNKTFRLSDDIFDISIGKRVVAADLNGKGKIPVYSANVFEPFGYIDKCLIDDFSVPSVLWGIDGDWMVNYVPADKPFYPTDHCGVLRVKTNDVLPKYLTWALNKEGIQQRFSRTLRASIDRIKGLTIKVPTLSEQQKIISKIEKIEAQINKIQKIVDGMDERKNEVLKRYL